MLAGGDRHHRCPDFDTAFLARNGRMWSWPTESKTRDLPENPTLGRGKTLSRPQRGRVWQVFEQYREALRGSTADWLTVIREARHLLESGKVRLSYRAVVVDEAQDFHPEEWRLIRAGTGGAERPLPGRGRPPADLRAESRALPLRHLDPGPVLLLADQLPNDRADPGLGDGDLAGSRGGRPRRQAR